MFQNYVYYVSKKYLSVLMLFGSLLTTLAMADTNVAPLGTAANQPAVTSTCHGCDCSLDTSSNNHSPGVTIPGLHGATNSVNKCISGSSDNSETSAEKRDYYYFIVQTDGTLTIKASSPNNHEYHLGVGRTEGAADIHKDKPAIQVWTSGPISLHRGDGIYIRIKETGKDKDEYQLDFNFTKKIDFTCANPKEFSIAKKINTTGNIILVGNTNICKYDSNSNQCVDPNSTANNNIDAHWKDGDANANTLNSSAAKLILPPGAEVLWAGLYWQGYFEFKPSPPSTLQAAQKQTHMIKLGFTPKKGVQSVPYTQLSADPGRLNHIYFSESRWYYQGFKEVTSYVKNHGEGWYWGADIATKLGKPSGGTLGAWSIAVIYKDQHDTLKNLTIFDGYLAIAGENDVNTSRTYASNHGCDTTKTGVGKSTSMKLTGFKTPRTGAVNSRLIFFGGEGDISYKGDSLSLQDKKGREHKITNNENPANNIANSSITDEGKARGDDILYPRYGENSIGIDIDTFDVSQIIGNDQNQTVATMNTNNDGYFPGVFGISTELYMPRLCYDYDVRIGDYIKIPSTQRAFKAQKWGNKNLQLKVLVRSEEGDFDFDYSKLRIVFSPGKVFRYQTGQSEISPQGINAYLPAVDTDASLGQIAIGHDYGADGGIIGPRESTYVKQKFAFDKPSFNGHFDLVVDSNITFTPGLTLHYTLSTANVVNGHTYFGRCPTNKVYDPIWGQFNIENSHTVLTDPESKRYPLYTQVTGRPFKVRVVHYTKGNSGKYDDPEKISATVEMELIDVSPFDNNASAGYDSTCQEPVAASKGAFIRFDNKESIEVTPTDTTAFPDYNSRLALRNAAFRIWMLTKDAGNGNRTMIDHNCPSATESSCFDQVYTVHYRNAEDNATHYCLSDCSSSTGSTCYDCLRTYFAHPVCSRDNFSIRPEGFKIVLNDTNETVNNPSQLSVNDPNVQQIKVAAGYKYQIKATTRTYGNLNDAIAYYKRFQPSTDLNLSSHASSSSTQLVLEFVDNTSKCSDQNSTAYALTILNGQTPSDTPNLIHSNAGQYALWLSDAEWTQVDQSTYAYKTIFDSNCKNNPDQDKCSDCVPAKTMSPLPGKEVGCTISSDVPSKNDYNAIPLRFEPYRFDLAGITLSTNPSNQKYLFMTDFDDSYYNNAANVLSNPMAAIYEGNITAIAKDGNVTTNFSAGCAAENVTLRLGRETNASENDLKSLFGINFQQYLHYEGSSNIFDDKQLGQDVNLTLNKAAFQDAKGPGTAGIQIYTTFKKPSKDDILNGDEGINPVAVNYRELNATSPDASSRAHRSIHIPKGTHAHDHNLTFLYAKVSPNEKQYVTQKNSVKTPLNILVYCSYGLAECSNYNLNVNMNLPHETSNWYLSSNLFSRTSDLGTSDLGVSYFTGKTPGNATLSFGGTTAPSLTDVGYEINGQQDDINVSLPTSNARPVTVEVRYNSSPWLDYDPTEEYYRVRFINASKWTGLNKTGHVVETNLSNVRIKRVEW
jgi:hypothetical protein